MKRILLIALVFASGFANADTLVINHPGLTETMHGTFLQMNMTETTGGLEFEVADYGAQESQSTIHPSKTIWHIGLWIDGKYRDTQGACTGAFAYNYGDPVLTLECAK